jgi:hypothetical protein
MPERPQYQLDKDAQRRAGVTFNRRDDVRDLMKSPMGQNYGNMMDLQSQAARQGGFDRGDPRVAELKAARRQYNRQDKYNIGNLMGYDPLEVQDMYRRNSEVLREHARPTYKQMYPVTDIARQVSGGGGLTGMLLNKILGRSKKAGKNFFDDLRGMGRDILGGVGIGGADRDVSEKELDDYAAKTFGFYPSDVHPGLPIEDETSLVDEKTREEQIQELVDEEQRKIDNFETDYHSDLLDDMAKDQWPTSGYRFEFDDYVQDRMDALRNAPPDDTYVAPPDDIEPLPFDEGREDFIRRQNEYVIPEPIFPENVRQDDPYETSAYEKWYNERLNNRLADQYQEWGPHRNEPRTSYYGSNWYDEYERQKRNEMEIAKGIRSPMDR